MVEAGAFFEIVDHDSDAGAENLAAGGGGGRRRGSQLHQFDRVAVGIAHEHRAYFAGDSRPEGKLDGTFANGDDRKALVFQKSESLVEIGDHERQVGGSGVGQGRMEGASRNPFDFDGLDGHFRTAGRGGGARNRKERDAAGLLVRVRDTLDERRHFLQTAIPAKWAGLVARAAQFEADEIVIEVHGGLDILDLAAEVAGAKSVSRRCDAGGRRVERRQRSLRRLRRSEPDGD